jgi:hypothetical protein
LCAPLDAAPTPELVDALIDHYERERRRDGQPVWVSFLGGDPPDDDLIDAIGGRPFVARVRPDRLSRDDAARLARRGAIAIELDATTRFVSAATMAHVSSLGDHDRGVRIGCEWHQLPTSAERTLQRWIEAAQRRRRLLALE